MIYGERIKQAREFRGFTQTHLANLIGVKQESISQIERNEFTPSDAVLNDIAKNTGFMPTFFELEPKNLPFGTLNYRARKALTAKEENQAYQYANILYQQIHRIAPDLPLPENKIPQLNSVPAKQAAQIVREALGYSGSEPIKKLVHDLERNGVFIFTLPCNIPNIDAFSTWAMIDEERPIIVMMPGKEPARLRFSIAHELGHLVMHKTLRGDLKLVENEANQFASELLMPEIAITPEITPPLTLTGLARLKLKWGVSMKALVMRARALKIISERQAKYLFTQLSSQGWSIREPINLDPKPDLPGLVRELIERKYKTRADFAIDSRLSLDIATDFYAFA